MPDEAGGATGEADACPLGDALALEGGFGGAGASTVALGAALAFALALALTEEGAVLAACFLSTLGGGAGSVKMTHTDAMSSGKSNTSALCGPEASRHRALIQPSCAGGAAGKGALGGACGAGINAGWDGGGANTGCDGGGANTG